jgi:alpha-L-rhamnosidase
LTAARSAVNLLRTGVVQDGRSLVIRTAAALLCALALGVAAAEPAAGGDGPDPARFSSPPSDSRPTILWFWNGTVTTEIVDRQLADMRMQGVDEVLVFPFDTPNLRPVFFSEGWFDLIEHTLREAQRHGMHVWLFNDDFFPSGRGGGLVVKEHPELRPDGIVRVTRTVEGGRPVDLDAGGDRGLRIEGGELVVDAQGRPGVTLLRDGTDWTDYDVEATVSVDRGTAGLMVRSPDERNGYLVDLRADGGVNVWRQTDGAFELLHLGDPVPGFDPAADHALRVALRDDRIEPSLDGRALPAVTDDRFPRGRVGVRAVADQLSRWDRLTVRDSAEATLYDETFDDQDALEAFAVPPSTDRLVAVAARPAEGAGDVDRIVDLTRLAEDGRAWDAPPGRWRIDVFTARDLAEEGTFRRNYLDLLDDEATERFLDAVPGEYYRRFPWAFGRVLRGFADDEPFIASADAHWQAIPWSRSLLAALARAGTSPAKALSAVHDDLGRDGRLLRGAFWRAVSDRFASAYYRRQGRWMREHGVRFISNPLWDEYGPAEQLRSTGNLNTVNQWAQVPGTDLVFDHFQLGYHRTLSRWAASTSHQMGLDLTYLEGMGAMGWGVTPALTRRVIGGFAARGVNFTLLHAMFTDPGFIPYPPPFQPLTPWWEKSRPLNDWIGRVMEAGRTEARAETALIQPQRAAEAWQDTPRVATIDAAFTGAAHALEDRQVDFDLLDEGALDGDPALQLHAEARGGRLRVGRQDYRVAVLPETPTLSLGAVRTLDRFVRGGGTLVAVGTPPVEEASGRDEALRRELEDLLEDAVRAADPVAAAEAAADAGAAAATLQPRVEEVRVLRLERSFLVVNESDRAVRTTATFPAGGEPELWDPESGETGPAGVWREAGHDETAVSLALDPHETAVVVFRDRGGRAPHAVSSELPVERVRSARDGLCATVRADRPGRFAVVAVDGSRLYRGVAEVLDPLAAIPLGGDWDLRIDGGDPVSRPLGSWTAIDPAFSGSATYERDFDLDAATLAGRRWTLDLGDVRDVAEVAVNGRELAPRLWPPYRLDVTDALRPGANTIRVLVTNTGANAHGQAQTSGLLGPVALRPERRLEVELDRVRDERVLEFDSEPIAVAPGQRRTVHVAVRDLARRPGTVALDLAGEGVAVTPATATVRLDANGEGAASIAVAAPDDAQIPGEAAVRIRSGDSEARLPVSLASASRLGRASASSSHPAHPPERANDGITDSTLWDLGQGWNDNTPDTFPDELSVAFEGTAPIGRIRLHTLDSAQYPASGFGISDADVQLLAGGEWRTVGEIRGNDRGLVELTFPTVEADAARVIVHAARVSYSRVIELEALP